MGELSGFGKVLIFFGLVMLIIGGILLIAHKIPFIGRLPGDIIVQKKNFNFYFPITSSIIISIILSIIMWLLSRR